MKHSKKEVERRTAAAMAAIKRRMEKNEGEQDVVLFVSHHLEELDAAYWEEQTGTSQPSPQIVLDLLELRSHWGEEDEDGIDTFDFTLPGDVTDYVISVRFDSNGEVEEISMES
jgi:Protein of unknown function (DUF2004)